MTSSNLRAIKSDKPSLISTMVEESLVKIFVKQKNPKNRTGEREIRIKFSELDAGINLQTWVMLLDFFTPSSAPLSTCDLERTRSTDTSSVKSDGMTQQARSIRRQAIENQAKPVDINIEFTVDRFSILFKKPEYKFAKVGFTLTQGIVRFFNTFKRSVKIRILSLCHHDFKLSSNGRRPYIDPRDSLVGNLG